MTTTITRDEADQVSEAPPPPPFPPAGPLAPPRPPRPRRTLKLAALVVAIVVLATFVVAAVFAALSPSGSGGYYSGTADRGSSESRAGAPAVGQSSDAARAADPRSPAVADPGVGNPAQEQSVGPDRAVVRTATVRVEVPDPAGTAGDVRAAVTAAGGYVADERSTTSRSSLTVKVPAAQLDAFVTRVAGLGTVTERSSTARDVTDQLVDTDARVAAQRASVDRVRTLLAQANSISEVVAIESELTRRQADLDSLERRLATLRATTELATVDVALVAAGAPPAAAGGTGFGDGLGVGWDWLRGLGAGLAAAAGFLLPLLPVVAVVVLAVWGVRRVVRSRRARPAPEDS
ncbi:hypothetical protein PSU4_11310 [Pseudonocardia sulfidoxydans NBRC 16205]|uniref:DUF4349 domain-containing protein n=1 Tax=Pseudonocardia sulfidoxydans NBRC 16205 TaxID=1223511 RepID=A0A511DC90_9PSEU|nr:DUF4349 domain-containing protein [Pseudonocardia sulfidoxydans]GEL22177.1 hypothetical protein PSU4_11310 [Pseudonocardia sulfidoxydans NBRC 16205]